MIFDGVHLLSSNSCIIKNNNIIHDSVGSCGFYIGYCNSTIIKSNNISSHLFYGIDIDVTNNISIINNKFLDNIDDINSNSIQLRLIVIVYAILIFLITPSL
jgi:parallel beta-helix repeat protein